MQVVLERVNSHVEIVVEDTGVGIRRDFLPYVFDRFRQADPSTPRRYGGLGLGLSIVKSLVELHGGSVRVKIARIVEGRGAIVTCAATAEEVLHHLSAAHFDVILSDIGMPDIDGNELIRKIRKLDTQGSRPITAIAITAYARPEDRQRSLLAGYQMHLSKPIEARELIAGIASLLHLRR